MLTKIPRNNPVVLSDQELRIIEEARVALGLETIEEALEALIRLRVRELMMKLAGREIVKTQRYL
ncbi:hypothetical protein F971_01505 [Acinetobacter vivianii]|uniref:Uncharacterized protein n=1 Tax=Acinetobacter vivianii TaxID=1776742 RepID=N8W6N4_9GAMM|nr:hypothetical protein [Acinetobacter vivianii]ENU92523.1 hypothetical protein F971_01505 [Acinetobacter vivianii]